MSDTLSTGEGSDENLARAKANRFKCFHHRNRDRR